MVRDPENYIFNEEDQALAFPNVPAISMSPHHTDPGFVAFFCAVHKRNVGDWEQDTDIDVSDVFPMPLRLACVTQGTVKGKVTASCSKIEGFIVFQELVLLVQVLVPGLPVAPVTRTLCPSIRFAFFVVTGGAPCAVPALCPRCVKSRLFSTAGSHGSQGPEFCTPDAVLNGSCTRL